MKDSPAAFALLGGTPAFSEPLHVAQLNLPDWQSTEAAFRGIFERRYFANNGPLVQELDERFAAFAGVRHAVSVTNGTVALMVMLRALEHNTNDQLMKRYLAGVTVAHKDCAGDRIRTNCGLFRLPARVVACVLTNENEDRRWLIDNESQVLMGRIGEAIVAAWRKGG